MEHPANIAAASATDEPPDAPANRPASNPATSLPAAASSPARAGVSTRLVPAALEPLLDPALAAGADSRPGRATRRDGWTPERIRIFLVSLAECGVVEDAARAAGMSGRSAYHLRHRAEGRAFHLAWAAAEQLARRRLSGDLLSRALHGCVELIVRDGKVWGERHRYDNRLSMRVLERLDRLAAQDGEEDRAARYVAQEFDQFLDLVCAGGDGAAEFVAARRAADGYLRDEAKLLERAENYRRYGVGLPGEIDVSDLDPAVADRWTSEQMERAARSGLLAELAAELRDADDAEEEEDGEEAEDEAADTGAGTDEDEPDHAAPFAGNRAAAAVWQAALALTAGTPPPRLPETFREARAAAAGAAAPAALPGLPGGPPLPARPAPRAAACPA